MPSTMRVLRDIPIRMLRRFVFVKKFGRKMLKITKVTITMAASSISRELRMTAKKVSSDLAIDPFFESLSIMVFKCCSLNLLTTGGNLGKIGYPLLLHIYNLFAG
jgi:hypothetical protein